MSQLVSWRVVRAIIDTDYNGDDDDFYNEDCDDDENSDDGIDYDRQERNDISIVLVNTFKFFLRSEKPNHIYKTNS